MTINPSDGNNGWYFANENWYTGSYGSPGDKDYISDELRKTPFNRIRMTSTNPDGVEAFKEWPLKKELYGKTF